MNNFKKFLPLFIFLACFLVYNFNLSYETSGDTRAAEILPVAIIKYHTLELKNFVSGITDQYWIVQSPITKKFISAYPIVPGLLATPIYWSANLLEKDIATHTKLLSKITASLISALAVMILFLVLRKLFDEKISLLMTAVFALSTDIWTTASRGLWQHGPSLLFINLALLFLLKYKTNKSTNWWADAGLNLFWSGLFMGLAIWNRPPNAILLLPLAVYALIYYRRAFLKFCLGGILPIILMLLYSWFYFGNFLSLGQAQNFNFGHPLVNGFVGLLFSPAHGLLIHAPIFIFSFVGLILAWRARDKFYLYLGVGIILSILLYAKWIMWWGGWSFGYRMLIETVPMLIILLAYAWQNFIKQKKWPRIIFVAFLTFSLATEILGAFSSPCRGWNFPENLAMQERAVWSWQNSPWVACPNLDSLLDSGKKLDILN